MISRREMQEVRQAVNKLDIKPPEVKPSIANWIIKRAITYDLPSQIVWSDVMSAENYLKEVQFMNRKGSKFEHRNLSGCYSKDDKRIIIFTDVCQEYTPVMLTQLFDHELDHAFSVLKEKIDENDISDTDNLKNNNPEGSELNRSWMENIVERISAMGVYPLRERDNFYYSNNYSGYFDSGPSLEMVMAMFGIGEYDILRNSVKSKNVLKRYVSEHSPFSFEEIDTTLNSFEHSYNILHNALYNGSNQEARSANTTKANIANGMAGMLNVCELHLNEELERTDVLENPDALERLAYRHNQLIVSFEDCLNNLISKYRISPQMNSMIYQKVEDSFRLSFITIHCLRELIRCRANLENVMGDKFKEAFELMKTSYGEEFCEVMSAFDKDFDMEEFNAIEYEDDATKWIFDNLAKYGVTPPNESCYLEASDKIRKEFIDKTIPPKVPLFQKIADFQSQRGFAALFGRECKKNGNNPKYAGFPVISTLFYNQHSFLKLAQPETTGKEFKFSKYTSLNAMDEKQKDKYFETVVGNIIQVQTPELRKALFQIIRDRYKGRGYSSIQIEGELAYLSECINEIGYEDSINDPTLDCEQTVTILDKKIVIDRSRVAKTKDFEKLYEDLSVALNRAIDSCYNDFKLKDSEGNQLNIRQYKRFFDAIHEKMAFARYYNKDLSLSNKEKKMFFAINPLKCVLANENEEDCVKKAMEGHFSLLKASYVGSAKKSCFDVDKYVEAVDQIYGNIGNTSLSESAKSSLLVNGCDLLLSSFNPFINMTLANYLNGYITSCDGFYYLYGGLISGIEGLRNETGSGSLFNRYVDGLFAKVFRENEGFLYVQKLIEKGFIPDNPENYTSQELFEMKSMMQRELDLVGLRSVLKHNPTKQMDETLPWKICIMILEHKCNDLKAQKLDNLPPKLLKSYALTLLKQNGVELPSIEEFKEHFAQAPERPIGIVHKETSPKEPIRITSEESQRAANVFTKLLDTIRPKFNLDGRGDPQHLSMAEAAQNRVENNTELKVIQAQDNYENLEQ